MTRALVPIRHGVLLIALATTAVGAPAAGTAREGERRTTNSLNLIYSAAGTPVQPAGASNGVGVSPSKPVVSNPYNVPLLQNAGSLRSTR